MLEINFMSTHPRPHPLHWRLRGEIQPPRCPRQGRPTIRWESAPSGPGAGRLREGASWGAPGRDRRSPSGFSKGSSASAGAGRGAGPGAPDGRSPKDAPSGRCRRVTRPGTGPPRLVGPGSGRFPGSGGLDLVSPPLAKRCQSDLLLTSLRKRLAQQTQRLQMQRRAGEPRAPALNDIFTRAVPPSPRGLAWSHRRSPW